MTGSKRYFPYTGDGGKQYAGQFDESNSESVATPGGALFDTSLTGTALMPGRLKPRFVNAFRVVNNEVRRKRFKVGRIDCYNAMAAEDGPVTIVETIPAEGATPASTITWSVTSLRPERKPKVYAADTGITDGDNP